MKKEIKKLVWVGVIAVVLIGGGILTYNATKPAEKKIDSTILVRANSHTTEQGTRTYPVTIVEFGDYQCPACAYVEPMVEKLLSEYPEVKLVFRHFPLPGHQHAMLASRAAEAAGEQGKFWEMHAAIYLNQDIWSRMTDATDAFVEMAKQLNLDVEKFKTDIASDKYDDFIVNDRKDGIDAGVNSTPSFFINGRKYLGGNNYLTLKLAVDEALKEANTQQTATVTP